MAARNASDAEISALREMLEFKSSMLNKPMEHERHNRAFHKAIYRSTHNRYLLNTLSALQTPMVLLRPATAVDPSRLQSAPDRASDHYKARPHGLGYRHRTTPLISSLPQGPA